MKDLISVIIPIFNRESYIHETMESVLNQTYENLEIILIDDGSTDDNILKIIRHYERMDKRVKGITQKNKGISLATKAGIEISSGKYIARCDGDDINEPDRYEKQLRYLKENNYDMVGVYLKSFGSGNSTAKKGIQNFNNRPIRNSIDQKTRIHTGSTITGGTFMAKASVLKKFNPFHENYSVVEDVYLYVILHMNGCKIGILEEVLYNYRVHNNNTSISRRKEGVYKYFEVIFRFLFKDLLYKYKNIVIIKRKDEEDLISHMLNIYFTNLNFKFVNEHNFNYFVSNEILNYDSEDTVFFVGNIFLDNISEILRHKKYTLYENLFVLVDCFWS